MKTRTVLILIYATWAITVCVMLGLMIIGQPIFLAGIGGIAFGVLLGLWIGKEEKENENEKKS